MCYLDVNKFFMKKPCQNKHVTTSGHYIEGRSILDHPHPDNLLQKFKGTGYSNRGDFGWPGYVEVVDFEESIGTWISKDGLTRLQTTKGAIHYGKKGAHIVPMHPETKKW